MNARKDLVKVLAGAAAGVLVTGLAVTCNAAVTPAGRGGGCAMTGAGPWSWCVAMPATGRPRAGEEITAAAGPDPGTPWLVTDKAGAPMAWVNLDGLYSGGDGGRHPGGLICVTRGVLADAICLTPRGTVVFSQGRSAVTLTARDVRCLHSLEAGRRCR